MFFSNSAFAQKGRKRCEDPIHFVTQYYLDADEERRREITEALRRNVENPHIDSITLLNERLYSWAELGIKETPKVEQVVVGRRALFSDLLAPRKFGFVVAANTDIFLDGSVALLRDFDLHERPAFFALLRYEYTNKDLEQCPIFGPRADSQDTWIWHSSLELPLRIFDFELGRAGCDNKLCYLLSLCGVEVYNDPLHVKTYHSHASLERAYKTNGAPVIPNPYCKIVPAGFKQPWQDRWLIDTYDLHLGNRRLYNYLKAAKGPFVIPRVAGIENVTAHAALLNKPLVSLQLAMMKNNTGVDLYEKGAQEAFAAAYWAPFERCELYASWEPWSTFSRHIVESQKYCKHRFQKPQFNSYVFDIFHFVYGTPWTNALAGKKVLIISAFADTMRTQPQPYRVDLFPNCQLSFMKPPMTQGLETNRGWFQEYADFCANVKAQDFDVALCSCGGYGNPICGFIYSLGKSAIYVGGVLQMYFGIYGTRWLKERPDVLRLHLKEGWQRPKERPKGFKEIEDACYW
jgi:hypothetical protein